MFCVLEQVWWELMLWCWIVHEFVLISCCYWFGTCCCWIGTFGTKIGELMMRFDIVIESWECIDKLVNLVMLMNLMCWCVNLKTYASLSVLKCMWPMNIFGIEFWGWDDQNWDFGVKRGWNRHILNCCEAQNRPPISGLIFQFWLGKNRPPILSGKSGKYSRFSPFFVLNWLLV